jgi:hypothetical protein
MKTFLEKVQNSEFMQSDTGKLFCVKQNQKLFSVSSLLNECECINIQNVFDYVTPLNNSGENWKGEDFPTIAPPFQTFFMEYQYTDAFWHGALFHAERLDDLTWLLSMVNFGEFDYGKGKVAAPHPAAMRVLLDEHGKILETDFKMNGLKYSNNLKDEDYFYFMRWTMVPCFLAISFMHCKNVSLISNTPRRSPSGRNKHGPRITYKTLEIEPMKKILQVEGQSEITGIKKALHICRGHFKDYRKNGLFGRNKNIYWWDSQVRGNISQGLVSKDYSVNPGSHE